MVKNKFIFICDSPGHVLEKMAMDISLNLECFNTKIIHKITPKLLYILLFSRSYTIVWLNTTLGCMYGGFSRNNEILFIHHGTKTEINKFLECSHRFYKLFTVSEEWKKFLTVKLNREILLYPLTVNTSVFVPKKSLKLNDKFTIGFVAKAAANRDDRKGVKLFLEICEKLKNILDFKIIIVGSGWSEEVFKAIGEIDFEIFQIQSYEQSVEYYGMMDILLITSNVEGGPITLLEAMASGTPVISTPVGHVPEIINGENSRIVKFSDNIVDEFIKEIMNFASDNKLLVKLKDNSREYVLQNRSSIILSEIFNFSQFF